MKDKLKLPIRKAPGGKKKKRSFALGFVRFLVTLLFSVFIFIVFSALISVLLDGYWLSISLAGVFVFFGPMLIALWRGVKLKKDGKIGYVLNRVLGVNILYVIILIFFLPHWTKESLRTRGTWVFKGAIGKFMPSSIEEHTSKTLNWLTTHLPDEGLEGKIYIKKKVDSESTHSGPETK